MNRVLESPISKTDLESEILQQLDKIAKTGNKFREQVSELGEKLKSFQEAQGQNVQKVQPSSISADWMKTIATKMQEVTNVQQKIYEEVYDLEKRRLNLQKLVAGKVEDVLQHVAMLKSWTETTKELKPKLEDERKIIQDLESQVKKMTGELKGKLDLLESTAKSSQNAVKSSLEKLGVPTVEKKPNESDGWIVIQRRDSGPLEDFERGWAEYENGFGSVDGNFWIGLKKIHELTADSSIELQVELTDWEGNSAYANYLQFSVGNSADLYRLSVSGYSGDAGDAFKWHDGSPFSTMDKKNGQYEGITKGGWWKNKNLVNLNGLYSREIEANLHRKYSGVYWFNWKMTDYPLQKVLMKIRKRK